MEANILEAYAKSQRRIFFLDYDGTLVGFKPLPSEAKPTPRLRTVLKLLASDPENTIVVISGRDHETLNEWLGDIPITLVAEHGFFVKDKDGVWKTTASVSLTWKQAIRPLMEAAARDVPEAFVEEKTSALVWHYNQSDPGVAAIAESRLRERVSNTPEARELTIMPGSKILEVRVADVDKGTAAKRWIAKQGWDFMLAAGDDTTDEDLFAVMPDGAFSIKIGGGQSIAEYRQPDYRAFLRLLSGICRATEK